MEIETPHQHHGHGTGFRWLDISLALAAFVTSVVSLWLGLHSASSMEKLVAANSYPNLDTSFSNQASIAAADGSRQNAVLIELKSTGVGPARIEWTSMRYKGVPVADVGDLLKACCSGLEKQTTLNMHMSSAIGDLLPPGKTLRLIEWRQPSAPSPMFDKLHASLLDIQLDTCYCSVFEECFVRKHEDVRPRSVKSCEVPKVPFNATALLKQSF